MGRMPCSTRAFALLTCSTLALFGCEGSSDENSPDTGSQPMVDAGVIVDASGVVSDASLHDASGAPDGATSDAGVDAGPDCTFVMPSDCVIPDNSALPSELRCTGLYAKFDERVLACNVLPYTPAYELWSDGAKKQRYVLIPAGKKVDTSDPLDPVYPTGTKFWKEFKTPDGAKLLETRLLEKSADGWIYTSYVWTADAKNAIQMNDGVPDVLGTGHAVPTRDQCDECHRGRKDKILGWDAFLLGPGAQGVTNADLAKLGFVDSGKEFPTLAIPGNDVERAALGYIHANCGISCHNNNMRAKAKDTGLMMRLEKDMLSAASATPVMRTGLYKVPGTNAKYGGITTPGGAAPRDYFRSFVPGDTQRSLSLVRMMTRGADGEMPSIASKKVDDAGVAIVRAWIEQMSPDAGYVMPPDAGM
jgi:hypothetical protein